MEIKAASPVVAGGVKPPKAAAGASDKQDAKLKAACADLEAVFLNLLLTQMRRTVPKDKLMGGGHQEEIMQSMLDGETTKNMAKAGGIGLADMMYRQLSPNVNKTVNKGQAPK